MSNSCVGHALGIVIVSTMKERGGGGESETKK
jgi:hypothetical protein